MNNEDKKTIELFIKSLQVFAETKDYNKVVEPFKNSDFIVVEDDSEAGGTFAMDGELIYNAVFFLEYDEENENTQTEPQIEVASLLFETEKTSLAQIQEIFGEWYRDPMDGEEASLAKAYFNPKHLVSNANFFLYADTEEDYIDKLLDSSPVSQIVATFRDDRYDTDNRPF